MVGQDAAPARAESLSSRLYRLVGSWKLSVVLTVSGALFYLFLSIWGARSPAHVKTFLRCTLSHLTRMPTVTT